MKALILVSLFSSFIIGATGLILYWFHVIVSSDLTYFLAIWSFFYLTSSILSFGDRAGWHKDIFLIRRSKLYRFKFNDRLTNYCWENKKHGSVYIYKDYSNDYLQARKEAIRVLNTEL